MSDEEKIVETELNVTNEKYFCINREKVCNIITGIITSFIGTSLALMLFAAMHKPPMQAYGHMFKGPKHSQMKMMDKRGHKKMDNRYGEPRRHQGELSKRDGEFRNRPGERPNGDFRKGRPMPPNAEGKRPPVPNQDISTKK